ncbi:MAG: hypothetical protein ACRD3C_05290 [Vicinamibacterales bacterium]
MSFRLVVVTALVSALAAAGAVAPASAQQPTNGTTAVALEEAQRLFYSGRYDAAAALALAARLADPENLAASELRSSALHFQIRHVFGTPENKDRAWKECASCPQLLAAFTAETSLGRSVARARLKGNPADQEALFFLGKLDLNVVWLQLATLGRKSGWSEYWEARKSLDAVLKMNPDHVRARVARAWIDYIVDTKVPFGTRWLLGGGNKQRGLQVVREAAHVEAPPYVQAEAMFALWDMQVRERNLSDAIVTARALARDFPENRDLSKFLSTHDLQGSR